MPRNKEYNKFKASTPLGVKGAYFSMYWSHRLLNLCEWHTEHLSHRECFNDFSKPRNKCRIVLVLLLGAMSNKQCVKTPDIELMPWVVGAEWNSVNTNIVQCTLSLIYATSIGHCTIHLLNRLPNWLEEH